MAVFFSLLFLAALLNFALASTFVFPHGLSISPFRSGFRLRLFALLSFSCFWIVAWLSWSCYKQSSSLDLPTLALRSSIAFVSCCYFFFYRSSTECCPFANFALISPLTSFVWFSSSRRWFLLYRSATLLHCCWFWLCLALGSNIHQFRLRPCRSLAAAAAAYTSSASSSCLFVSVPCYFSSSLPSFTLWRRCYSRYLPCSCRLWCLLLAKNALSW